MGRKISLSINLSAINKDWFITGKGTPPKKYLAIDLYENDQIDAYGNGWSMKQTPPKDVRADMKQRGEKIPYCGNGKEWSDRQAPAPAPKSATMPTSPPQENIDEDVPF